jgi:hypothetical protein
MVEYKWNPETHTATCKIEVQGKKYIGTAICHEHDFDFESEKVGQVIAGTRAQIKMLQDYANNSLVPQLKALMEYYYTIKHSKNYNPKSYESKMLYRRIQFIKNQLTAVKEEINNRKQELKEYIDQKDEFYKKLRANRNKSNSDAPSRGLRAKMDNLIN